MSTTRTASEQITEEVTSWPGVEAGTGTRGEYAFKLGRREIGHLHGDHALHIGFPKEVWKELFAQGRIDYHPVFPGKPGYAARRIDNEEDIRDVIELLRLNYDRAVERHGLPAEVSATAGTLSLAATARRGGRARNPSIPCSWRGARAGLKPITPDAAGREHLTGTSRDSESEELSAAHLPAAASGSGAPSFVTSPAL